MVRPRSVSRAVLAAAVAAVLAACSPAPTPPPPHPFGPECTWPTDVDPNRMAVLSSSIGRGELSIHLLDVTTGMIIARCAPLNLGVLAHDFADSESADTQETQVPIVSPDLRHALGNDIVVDLATGTTTPAPQAFALLDSTRVLRRLTPNNDSSRPTPASDYCIAPTPDAAPTECTPLPGDGDGDPAIHPDGTVGWAPNTTTHITLTGTDTNLPARIQTDGTTIVQLRIGEQPDSSEPPALINTRHSGRVNPLRYPPADKELDKPLVWYTAEPDGGRLHVSRATTGEIRARFDAFFDGIRVIDDGNAVILTMSSHDIGQVALLRVDLDGTITEIARIPTHRFGRFVGVLHWPDNPGAGLLL